MPVPVIEVGDQVEVQLLYTLDAQTCINTFHYRCSAKTGTEPFFQASLPPQMVDYLWTSDATNQGIDELVSQDLRLVAVTAQVLRPVRLVKSVSFVGNLPGLVTDIANPSGVSAVIRRQGGQANRQNYGRIYLPGIPQTFVTESILTTTAYGLYQNFATRLSATFSKIDPTTAAGISLTPIVAIKPTITESHDVAIGTVDQVIRYQRRREVGVGL